MTPSPVQKSDLDRLHAAGWIEEFSCSHPWRWREPKTRALYRLQDAIDLLNVRKQPKESPE